MPEQHASEQERERRLASTDLVTRVRGERLTLTLRRTDEAVLVEAFGELDLASTPVLTRALADVAAPCMLVLDVARLSFLDASGLRGLLGLGDGRTVVLRNPSPLVQRILEVTGTTSCFRIEPA